MAADGSQIFKMYELNFIGQVLESLQDAKEGNTIATEELLKKVDQWEE